MRAFRCVAIVSCLLGSTGVAQTTGDDAAVRQLIAGYAAARANGNGAAQAKFYAPDGDEWRSMTRAITQGHDALVKDLDVPPSATRKFSIAVERVAVIEPTVAVVDATFFGADPRPNGHLTFVLVKRAGEWLIQSERVFRYSEASAGRAGDDGLGDDPMKFDQRLDAAYLHRDLAFLDKVLADDMQFKHGVEEGDGPAWDKRAFMAAAKDYTGRERNVDSVRIERHGDIVETLGHIQVKTSNPQRPEYHVYYVRLYRRGPAGWQFVSHRTVREIQGALATK